MELKAFVTIDDIANWVGLVGNGTDAKTPRGGLYDALGCAPGDGSNGNVAELAILDEENINDLLKIWMIGESAQTRDPTAIGMGKVKRRFRAAKLALVWFSSAWRSLRMLSVRPLTSWLDGAHEGPGRWSGRERGHEGQACRGGFYRLGCRGTVDDRHGLDNVLVELRGQVR